MKARLLELLVVLSRAAAEGGAGIERLLNLNYTYIGALERVSRWEDLCAWILDALDVFMDITGRTRQVKKAKLIAEATAHIREHYGESLTLEAVGRVIFISPFYLSHLFKEELDLTFVEYLTRVRMEEAKKLLVNKGLSVLGVAQKVGYEDASYFSKVFRRAAGLSPNEYRKGC
jgi:two-component system response regulator YesN